MAKKLPNICADCKNFKCYDSSDIENPEDQVGMCKATDQVVYGDDEFAESCESFKSGKHKMRKRNW